MLINFFFRWYKNMENDSINNSRGLTLLCDFCLQCVAHLKYRLKHAKIFQLYTINWPLSWNIFGTKPRACIKYQSHQYGRRLQVRLNYVSWVVDKSMSLQLIDLLIHMHINLYMKPPTVLYIVRIMQSLNYFWYVKSVLSKKQIFSDGWN